MSLAPRAPAGCSEARRSLFEPLAARVIAGDAGHGERLAVCVTALDPAHQLDAMALLRSIARDGAGVVAALHDLTLAVSFCDRIVVLAGGRLVANGTPEEALTNVLLAKAFGVTAERGWASDGTRFILSWAQSGAQMKARDDVTIKG